MLADRKRQQKIRVSGAWKRHRLDDLNFAVWKRHWQHCTKNVQTTANNRKQPQTTANNYKQPQTTTNNHKQPQTTTNKYERIKIKTNKFNSVLQSVDV
jgi:hypothetical protein